MTGLKLSGTLVFVCLLFRAGWVHAEIPSLPGAYHPLPSGKQVAFLHLHRVEADEIHAGGRKVADDVDLRLNQAMLRYLHYTDVKDMPLLFEGGIPYAEQSTGATDVELSGLGDIFVGATLWPYADRNKGRFAGVAFRVMAPTGSKKAEGFSPSADRWAYNFQTAYVHRLGDSKVYAEAVGEYEVYSDTDKLGIETDPLYQVYANLHYEFGLRANLSLQYRHKWGAEQTLNGARVASRLDNNSLGVAVGTFVTKNTHILGHVSRDINVRQGPEVTVYHLRLGYLF